MVENHTILSLLQGSRIAAFAEILNTEWTDWAAPSSQTNTRQTATSGPTTPQNIEKSLSTHTEKSNQSNRASAPKTHVSLQNSKEVATHFLNSADSDIYSFKTNKQIDKSNILQQYDKAVSHYSAASAKFTDMPPPSAAFQMGHLTPPKVIFSQNKVLENAFQKMISDNNIQNSVLNINGSQNVTTDRIVKDAGISPKDLQSDNRASLNSPPVKSNLTINTYTSNANTKSPAPSLIQQTPGQAKNTQNPIIHSGAQTIEGHQKTEAAVETSLVPKAYASQTTVRSSPDQNYNHSTTAQRGTVSDTTTPLPQSSTVSQTSTTLTQTKPMDQTLASGSQMTKEDSGIFLTQSAVSKTLSTAIKSENNGNLETLRTADVKQSHSMTPSFEGKHTSSEKATVFAEIPSQTPNSETSTIPTPGPLFKNDIRSAAFSEALLLAVEAALSKSMGSNNAMMPSGVIFNAAMMPGWPFSTALVRDNALSAANSAALKQMNQHIEGLSPEEAAAYLAQIGGSYKFLKLIQKLLKEIEPINKEDVKGLLFGFLDVICSCLDALQNTYDFLAETHILEDALVTSTDLNGTQNLSKRTRLQL